MEYWKKRLKYLVTFWLVKNILVAVHQDEILMNPKPGHWYIGNRRLAPDEIALLKQEARDFEKSYLWKIMSKDIRYMAFLRATNKAQTDADLIYAGAMYYNLELLEKFMAQCKRKL